MLDRCKKTLDQTPFFLVFFFPPPITRARMITSQSPHDLWFYELTGSSFQCVRFTLLLRLHPRNSKCRFSDVQTWSREPFLGWMIPKGQMGNRQAELCSQLATGKTDVTVQSLFHHKPFSLVFILSELTQGRKPAKSKLKAYYEERNLVCAQEAGESQSERKRESL